MNKTIRKFFWQGGYTKRKYHMVRWLIICRPTKKGDLGIHDLKNSISTCCVRWPGHSWLGRSSKRQWSSSTRDVDGGARDVGSMMIVRMKLEVKPCILLILDLLKKMTETLLMDAHPCCSWYWDMIHESRSYLHPPLLKSWLARYLFLTRTNLGLDIYLWFVTCEFSVTVGKILLGWSTFVTLYLCMINCLLLLQISAVMSAMKYASRREEGKRENEYISRQNNKNDPWTMDNCWHQHGW